MRTSNLNNSQHQIELLAPSLQPMELPKIESFDIKEKDLISFPESCYQLFEIKEKNSQNVTLNKMKNCGKYNIAVFSTFNLHSGDTISIENFILKISNFTTKAIAKINLSVTLKKMLFRSLGQSKFVNFNYVEFSNNTGILFLILFREIYFYKISEIKNEIKYENICKENRNDGSFVFFLGCESQKDCHTFHLLVKPSNTFLAYIFRNENGDIKIKTKKEIGKCLPYKLERFTLTTSFFSLFVEKEDNLNVLINKNTFQANILKCPVNLSLHSFFIFPNAFNEFFLFTDINEGNVIMINIFQLVNDSKLNYESHLIQTIKITTNTNTRYVFNMTNGDSFDIFLGDQFLIFLLDQYTKEVSEIYKINLIDSFASKKFDLSLYNNEKENKILLSVFKDDFIVFTEIKHPKKEKNLSFPPSFVSSLSGNKKEMDKIFEETKQKISEEEISVISKKIDKILDEKLEIVEKKLESKYGATLDLLNKQYKMIETLNSQNNVKLNEIIKKQNLILNEENKIKKFEKNVTFPQTATSFTIEGEEYEGSDENEQKIPFMNSQNNIFNNNVNHQNIHSMNQMMNQQCNPYMLLNLIQQVQSNSQLQMAQLQMLRNIQNQMLNPGNGNPNKEKLINNWFREGFNSTNTNFMSYSDENKNNYSENQKLETINQMNTNFNDENKKEDLEGFIEIGKKKNNNKHLKKLKNK